MFAEGETPTYCFRSLNEGATFFFKEHPEFVSVLRAYSAAYRGETKDAWTAVSVARDLESSLRIVAKAPGIRVKPMRLVLREIGVVVGPTGDLRKLVRQELEEIVAE